MMNEKHLKTLERTKYSLNDKQSSIKLFKKSKSHLLVFILLLESIYSSHNPTPSTARIRHKVKF